MSWEAYVKNLTDSGHLAKVAICGLDGNVWAATPQFTPSVEEVQLILSGLKKKDTFFTSGIKLCGEKYMYITSDDGSAQGKKGPAGCTVAKSGKCVIVGVYKEGQQPGNARDAAEKMRDYLVQNSY